MAEITKEQFSKISLGYNWNPEMSFDEFCKANKKICRQDGFDIYEKINERYIHFKFEVL